MLHVLPERNSCYLEPSNSCYTGIWSLCCQIFFFKETSNLEFYIKSFHFKCGNWSRDCWLLQDPLFPVSLHIRTSIPPAARSYIFKLSLQLSVAIYQVLQQNVEMNGMWKFLAMSLRRCSLISTCFFLFLLVLSLFQPLWWIHHFQRQLGATR